MKRLRVHFDQNCMNARGTDAELQAVQRLHDDGAIQLVGNLRNRIELGRPESDGAYKRLARQRLARLEESPEEFRLDVSPLDLAVLGEAGVDDLNPVDVWSIVFPKSPFPIDEKNVFDGGQNSIHDVMHIVNAHDAHADVFLTREDALIDARERLYAELGLRPRIERPSEFLNRLSNLGADS